MVVLVVGSVIEGFDMVESRRSGTYRKNSAVLVSRLSRETSRRWREGRPDILGCCSAWELAVDVLYLGWVLVSPELLEPLVRMAKG